MVCDVLNSILLLRDKEVRMVTFPQDWGFAQWRGKQQGNLVCWQENNYSRAEGGSVGIGAKAGGSHNLTGLQVSPNRLLTIWMTSFPSSLKGACQWLVFATSSIPPFVLCDQLETECWAPHWMAVSPEHRGRHIPWEHTLCGQVSPRCLDLGDSVARGKTAQTSRVKICMLVGVCCPTTGWVKRWRGSPTSWASDLSHQNSGPAWMTACYRDRMRWRVWDPLEGKGFWRRELSRCY